MNGQQSESGSPRLAAPATLEFPTENSAAVMDEDEATDDSNDGVVSTEAPVGVPLEAASFTIEQVDPFAEDSAERTVITTIPFELAPKFTGRSDALEKLADLTDRAFAERRLGFALLVGGPGLGKSKTLSEFARRARGRHTKLRLFTGACDESTAYAAFGKILSQRFKIAPTDRLSVQHEKISDAVAAVLPAPKVTEVAHLLAHLMRVPFPDSPVIKPLAELPQQLEARAFIAARRFLAADADQAPLALCFENIESSGAELINLIHYLVAGLASSPVVIVGTANESLFGRHPSFGEGDAHLERIDLGTLNDAEAEALFRELCRPLDEVPAQLVAHAKKLGGSPRALFELVRFLLESDIIVRSGSMSWRIDKARLATTTLPIDYAALVRARLGVMDRADRELLSMAATIGETFWLDALVAVERGESVKTTDPDGPTLAEIAGIGDRSRNAAAARLSSLVDREWLVTVPKPSFAGEREYRFTYPNLCELVLAATDPVARTRYHRTAALWLNLRPEGRDASSQESIARHLELAGDKAAAAESYRLAAESAREHYFNERAIRLYASALECIGSDNLGMRIYLWHDLGSIYELIGDFESALGSFERMLRLAWVGAAKAKAAVAYNKMGRVWRRKGDLKLALEYLERGEELFEQAGDARGIASSLDDIGRVLYLLGRYDEAFERVTQALQARGKDGDRRSIAASLSSLGNIQKDRGRFQEAHACHTESLELRRSLGDRWGVIVSLNNLAVLSFDVGDPDAARAGWKQALAEAEGIGALPLQAVALSNLGELALDEGHHEEARSRLEEALDIAEDIDDRRLQNEAMRNLALLEKAIGNAPRARTLAHDAHQLAAAAGLRDNEGRSLLTLGEVHSASLFDSEQTDEVDGKARPAEEYFRRGIDVLREIGNEAELAKGLELLGCYKLEQGDVRAGRDLLGEALTLFERLGMKRAGHVREMLASV